MRLLFSMTIKDKTITTESRSQHDVITVYKDNLDLGGYEKAV